MRDGSQLAMLPSDVSALAQFVAGRVPGDETRAELAARAGDLESVAVLAATWSQDAQGDHYVIVESRAKTSEKWLLQLASTKDAGLVSAVPFSSHDHEAIAAFASRIAPEFLPRPQVSLPAIAAGNRHPEISLPAVFAAYGDVLRRSGVNMASTAQLSATREMTTDDAIARRTGEDPIEAGHTRVSIRHLYHAGVWAAISAGWRQGWTAEADHFIVTGADDAAVRQSVESSKEAIRHAAGFTKFTTDTSRLFELRADVRHPEAMSDGDVDGKLDTILSAGERAWLFNEFCRRFDTGDGVLRLELGDVARMAVKFAPSLKLNEELYDYIVECKGGAAFDFEPSIDEAETLTTPKELLFYLHWLGARGRRAQLAPPNLGFKKRQAYPESLEALSQYARGKMWPELVNRAGSEFAGNTLAELGSRIRELAAVARLYDCTLSIHSGSGKQAAVLEGISQSTRGRLNYKISGELQLQLFDVMSEQPAGSPERALFDRMVARCNAFAARSAFGYESELAAKYHTPFLGSREAGRMDGNLFLVFWLGNIVGSRDVDAPDGDTRFFKEKLDELPREVIAEAQRRNTEYIVWLASHLRG